MATDRRRGLIAAGVGLLGAAGLLALDHQSKNAPSGGSPGGHDGGGAPLHCVVGGTTSDVKQMSRFYNWTDLRTLPLNPSDPHDWSHGGTFAELGIRLPYNLPWTEARHATAPDGTVGWWLRISDRNYRPGDWAVPAIALGVVDPCG